MTTVPRFRFPIGYDTCDSNTPPQQQQKLLFIRPFARFELTCFNTGSFSQYQLQMRAKAEVLQYKPKHQRLSRAQKQSLASRKHYSKRHHLPKAHIDENGNLVPAKNTTINNGVVFFDTSCDKIIISKSTASDVPGPAIDLFLDPNVPLIYSENPQRIYRAGGTNNVDNTIYNEENAGNLS